MNLKFMNLLLDKCNFPEDAKDFLNSLAAKVIEDGYESEFDSFIDTYIESGHDTEKMDGILAAFVEKAGGNVYSYWMLLLILAAERAKPLYEKRGVSDEVFWDTFSDLRCKALECKEEKGVWGIFVAFWYRLFFSCRIIKFGRLEYQDETYDRGNDYTCGDVKVKNGRRILSIHIPSSGEPFDYESRMKSYKMAYDFYSKELGQDELVCECGSWLLYPEYKDLFGEGSNSADFMNDFDVIASHESENFDDDWRVFGKAHSGPVEDYPEDTRMRRAFKKHLLEGGKLGSACGILIFDGEKLLTRKDG